MLTLSAILSFVAQSTNTCALCARAMTATLRVDALTDGNIAFWTLPSAIADTRSLVILTISTAEDWARRLGKNRKRQDSLIWVASDIFLFVTFETFCLLRPLNSMRDKWDSKGREIFSMFTKNLCRFMKRLRNRLAVGLMYLWMCDTRKKRTEHTSDNARLRKVSHWGHMILNNELNLKL